LLPDAVAGAAVEGAAAEVDGVGGAVGTGTCISLTFFVSVVLTSTSFLFRSVVSSEGGEMFDPSKEVLGLYESLVCGYWHRLVL
jgi:hypothetical protein